MSCKNIIENGLVANFDLSNQTYPLSLYSTVSPRSNKNTMLDSFGLNMYDIGRVLDLNETKTLVGNDKLKLEPVLYYDNSGNTNIFTGNFINDPNIGGYLTLSGDSSYFNAVYKYEGYDYSYINDDFTNGFTIEMVFQITDPSLAFKSTIFYIGARAVDKFNPVNNVYTLKNNDSDVLLPYNIFTVINDEEIEFVLQKEDIVFKEGIAQYKGIFNIENVFIYNNTAQIPSDQYSINFRSKQITSTGIVDGTYEFYYYTLKDITYVNYDVNYNNLEYYTGSDNVLNDNFLKINLLESGNLEISLFSNNKIVNFVTTKKVSFGWNTISVVFRPLSNVDPECYTTVNSRATIYINGQVSLNEENVPYPFFRGIEDIPFSRQIGLPYNIFWGGDSFGLTHSYVFDINDDSQYNKVNYFGLLETTQNTSFNGGIQKLRIYNRSLTFNEVKNNSNIDMLGLKINKNKGGRLIYI